MKSKNINNNLQMRQNQIICVKVMEKNAHFVDVVQMDDGIKEAVEIVE